MAQAGKCLSKCGEVREIALMEVEHGGLTTRATEISSLSSVKRMKVEQEVDRQVNGSYPLNSPQKASSAASRTSSGRVGPSRGSSKASREFTERELISEDLKVEFRAEGFENEISKLTSGSFRETTPSSEICTDTGEMESSTARKQSAADLSRTFQSVKSPTAAELEEFFSAAEKADQKRFMDKYNFDVVKDVPLEGRYEWVRIKP